MGLRRYINFLVAVFVTAGLAVAPLVTPVAAKPMAPIAMADDMPAMSADMPCCPDKQNSNDCRDCPLVAMCVLKVSLAGPNASEFPARLPTRVQLFMFVELITEGLDRPPPDHPPRNLV
jgi:hypothetical protein